VMTDRGPDHISLCTSVLAPMKNTLNAHSPFRETFIHSDKFAVAFRRANVFYVKRNHLKHVMVGRIDMVFLYCTVTQEPVHSMARPTVGTWQIAWWWLVTFKSLQSVSSVSMVHRLFFL
jgi:hypothetical protein